MAQCPQEMLNHTAGFWKVHIFIHCRRLVFLLLYASNGLRRLIWAQKLIKLLHILPNAGNASKISLPRFHIRSKNRCGRAVSRQPVKTRYDGGETGTETYGSLTEQLKKGGFIMERFGKLNIAIGIDSRYCAECGAPELEDGCSNASCWRARPNSRFPISLAIQQLAIERTFPSGTARKGLMHKYLHSLCLSILSPTGSRA